MAKYIALLNWTDQGVRNAQGTLDRANTARKAFQSAGGKITDIYWTIGPYDVVVIFEAPDNDTAYRMMLQTSMQGNVKTVTMPALDEQAMANVLKSVG